MQYAIAKGEIITVSVMLYELSHWWKLMLPATFAPQDYFHRVCFTSCTCRYSYNVQYSDWRHYMLSQVFFVIQREPLLAAWLRCYFGSRQILVWSAGNQEGPYNAWWRIADDPVADLSGRKFRRLSVRPSVCPPRPFRVVWIARGTDSRLARTTSDTIALRHKSRPRKIYTRRCIDFGGAKILEIQAAWLVKNPQSRVLKAAPTTVFTSVRMEFYRKEYCVETNFYLLP